MPTNPTGFVSREELLRQQLAQRLQQPNAFDYRMLDNPQLGGYAGEADPSLGTNVVIDGQTQNFAEGVTPYTFLGGAAPQTVAEGSPEYHALRDDARTRNQQGIAKVAAVVGGGAALGAAGGGAAATGAPAYAGPTTAAGLPTGAASAAGGGVGAMSGGVPAVGASPGTGSAAAGSSWIDKIQQFANMGGGGSEAPNTPPSRRFQNTPPSVTVAPRRQAMANRLLRLR